ncbi:MAG: nitroreductase family protein [Rikenellaceae bacterium]
MNNIIENILSRSSVREFTTERVAPEMIEIMLRAAMSSPSACNCQPWEFVVIDDREILNTIPKYVKGAHMAARAQHAIAICGVMERTLDAPLDAFWIQDCASATENMLLAAHAMDLGAVWCGVYPDNGTSRVEAISKLLNLPEGVIPMSIVVFGHKKAQAAIHDKWRPEYIHYNKF